MISRLFPIFWVRSIHMLSLAAMMIGLAGAQQVTSAPSSIQSLQDAWWTGPLLANSANTLPRGHFLVEPYIYDVIGSQAHAVG
jgi:hypothetical protein